MCQIHHTVHSYPYNQTLTSKLLALAFSIGKDWCSTYKVLGIYCSRFPTHTSYVDFSKHIFCVSNNSFIRSSLELFDMQQFVQLVPLVGFAGKTPKT